MSSRLRLCEADVKTVPGELSAFARFFDACASNPNLLLAACYDNWQDTKNPSHMWHAIDICARHKCDFPDWIREYLGLCAKRMMAEAQSKASKDLRAILPKVLGFPAKRGRGHPLRPDGSEDYMTVAWAFAGEIAKGRKPSDALSNASKVLHKTLGDKIDYKTLLGHIKKHFDLKKAPRTNAEWKKAISNWYLENFGPLEKIFRELST
jgi:hypothetical protein